MFGLRPTGLRSFRLTPRLASDWDDMSLKHIRAFGGDFDLAVGRLPGNKLEITVKDTAKGTLKRMKISDGATVEINLGK